MPTEYRPDTPAGKPFANSSGLLLYILPSPLIFKLLVSLLIIDLGKIAFSTAALFFFYSAAHLTRTTLLRLQEQPTYRPQNIKDNRLWAAIYITVGVLIVMMMLKASIPRTLVMAACGFIGYYLAYGLPQRQEKPALDDNAIPEATRKALKAAYADLETIEALNKQLTQAEDQAMRQTLDNVLEQSYVIMDLLVQTPQDAGRARRFLNVYINRIKEILQQYLKLAAHGKADNLRERLSATLTEVEQAFREKKSQLLDDDQFKLDVQLEVLDEQIKHED